MGPKKSPYVGMERYRRIRAILRAVVGFAPGTWGIQDKHWEVNMVSDISVVERTAEATGEPLPFGLVFEERFVMVDAADGTRQPALMTPDGRLVDAPAMMSGPCGGTTTCDIGRTTWFGLDEDLWWDGE